MNIFQGELNNYRTNSWFFFFLLPLTFSINGRFNAIYTLLENRFYFKINFDVEVERLVLKTIIYIPGG